ncbi:hypothetical protein [Streptomyces graminilatus]|uniref:hypothetical protein n=1 Tax=Streptomyces graminilatus TaxID=1464070 RepID=UPI0006E18617|nr:hypothetical protein [Streptomyces graminilatus]
MTPWLRILRVCGTLLALAAPTLAAAPHGTRAPYDGVVYVAGPAPAASRAGSPAGEGRERPGRRESAPSDEAAYEEPVTVTEPASVPDGPPRSPGARHGTVSGPVLPILPLGGGLLLIGSGLGLAFLALRLRVRRT